MKSLKKIFATIGCATIAMQQGNATQTNNAPIFANATNAFANTTIHTTASTSMADSSRIHNLDEIVVVAQPKESHILRKQPLASSIFTSAEIGKLGIRSISDISAYVPSFSMPAYGSHLTSSMYIRGIGSRVNNPAVGIYIDGMPILSKSAYNMHIYQIDRADILRGPQGTLYGMNTEGGLLRFYSKNPMTQKGTDVKLGIGSKLYRNVEAANYSRIDDATALSIAAFYNGQKGFFRNSTTGKGADSYNEAGAKLRLAHAASNKWNYDLTSDFQYVNENAFPYGVYDLATKKTAAPATNRENKYKRSIFNSALNIRYMLPGITVSSTTSYQFLHDDMAMDQDYTALDYMHLRQRQLQNGLTQEIAIKRNKRRWKYATGMFGSYQWSRTDAPVFFDSQFTSDLASTIESAAHGFIKVNSIGMEVPGVFNTPQLNIGVFHESSIEITDRLAMTIGLRYDYSQTKIKYQTSATMDMNVSAMGHDMASTLRSTLNSKKSDTYNQVLPKLGFTLKTDGNGSNIYALVNKGYRAGGYNIQMFSDVLQAELQANRKAAMGGNYDIPHTQEDYDKINSTISYKPEFCWNYELGAHLNLFGNTTHADLSAYYMKIRNQQLSVMAGKYGYGRMMVNAGRSHSCGVEASLRGKAIDNRLSWNATYSYTRSVFDKYTEESNGNVIDHANNKVPFIPQHSMSMAADWTIHVKASCIKSIIVGANTTAQGKTFWDEANTYSQHFYATLGAHADITTNNVSVSLWGRNITSTRYNTFAFGSNATGKQMYFAQRGTPFQVGADINIHL